MPPPARLYNGPTIPTEYVPTWQSFTNLTVPQRAWFASQPQFLAYYITLRRWQWEVRAQVTPGPPTAYITLPASPSNPDIAGIQLYTDAVSQGKIANLKQAVDNGAVSTFPFPFLAVNGVFQLSSSDITALYGYALRYVQSTYQVAATLLAAANSNLGSLISSVPAATPNLNNVVIPLLLAPIDEAFAAITVS